jgi:hypothetical protein
MKNGNSRVIAFAIIFICLGSFSAFGQVQTVDEIITPEPQEQGHGGLTPWFWIGIQTVFSAGYNLETTAGGFRNYGGDNNTYASFNVAFVDSHYTAPKLFQVPGDLKKSEWTGHFVMMNFTSKLNSWETSSEINAPAWLAEIAGQGFRIGFFTQAATLIGSVEDPDRSGNSGSSTESKPFTSIKGGNLVLNLQEGQEGQLGTMYYEKSTDPLYTTTYRTDSSLGGIWYVGYNEKDLYNAYLTMLSEGDVNSDVEDGKNKGFAAVVDFNVTPLGVAATQKNPLIFSVGGNFITGFGWKDLPVNEKQNVGFGLKADTGVWLAKNMVITPLVAFDGKLNLDNDFFYRVGGGLTFQFSDIAWTKDDWGDLSRADRNAASFRDYRYENDRILKYAYAQVYGASVPDKDKNGNDDFHLLFRVEEPDGRAGFHNKLGFMAEFRLYNMMEKALDALGNHKEATWEAQARVSWDFDLGEYPVTPYLRGYLNHQAVFKVRVGAYANIIPYTGFEVAYTSANINKGADITGHRYLDSGYTRAYGDRIFDAGRLEFMVILKSDDSRPQVPKRMSDWNYPQVIQEY